MKFNNHDASTDHFRSFATSLERAIERYGDLSEESVLERQKRQVETLVQLEIEFRTALIQHRWGPGVYKAFVRYICDERRNLLAARPFFRERQEIFAGRISLILKEREWSRLCHFHFNFQFVQFTMRLRKWSKRCLIRRLAEQIAAIRTEIIEMNMPLAISRARIFWSRTPKAQLTYMDLIQISCEGLMSAVDKFCLPYSRVFRSVAIGRMVGNFIEEYSETLVHFYPLDKRKIYRANKLVSRFANAVDFERLADQVNTGVDDSHRTSPAEIADLMAAASCVSMSSAGPSDPDLPETVDRFPAPDACRPDLQAEQDEAFGALGNAIQNLTLFEKKLLRLKGVQLGTV